MATRILLTAILVCLFSCKNRNQTIQGGEVLDLHLAVPEVNKVINKYYDENIGANESGMVVVSLAKSSFGDTTRVIISSIHSRISLDKSLLSYTDRFPFLVDCKLDQVFELPKGYTSYRDSIVFKYLTWNIDTYNPVVWQLTLVSEHVIRMDVLN
ncbi:MAG: hypothetical protein JST14_13130 [Bacteroidetes bacterium]|nr:hypothetical protein [Bacteroidota bacterium]